MQEKMFCSEPSIEPAPSTKRDGHLVYCCTTHAVWKWKLKKITYKMASFNAGRLHGLEPEA